jgi:hypothetical protein
MLAAVLFSNWCSDPGLRLLAQRLSINFFVTVHLHEILWLLQVGLDDIDQLFCAFGFSDIALPRWVHDMNSNMILDDLSQQAIQGAAGRYGEMEHVRASFLLFQGTLDGLDLAPNPPHPV